MNKENKIDTIPGESLSRILEAADFSQEPEKTRAYLEKRFASGSGTSGLSEVIESGKRVSKNGFGPLSHEAIVAIIDESDTADVISGREHMKDRIEEPDENDEKIAA